MIQGPQPLGISGFHFAYTLALDLYRATFPRSAVCSCHCAPCPPAGDGCGVAAEALKQCLERGLSREAVHLYSLLGQHERAVELALTLDVNLAAECAAGKKVGD